jgi:nicotinate (nicotinamide) nucleotide adenylyltransferase
MDGGFVPQPRQGQRGEAELRAARPPPRVVMPVLPKSLPEDESSSSRASWLSDEDDEEAASRPVGRRPPFVAAHSGSAKGDLSLFEGGVGDASVPTPRTAQKNARRVKQLEERVRQLEAQLQSDTGRSTSQSVLAGTRGAVVSDKNPSRFSELFPDDWDHPLPPRVPEQVSEPLPRGSARSSRVASKAILQDRDNGPVRAAAASALSSATDDSFELRSPSHDEASPPRPRRSEAFGEGEEDPMESGREDVTGSDPLGGWLARELADEASATAYVARPSTAEATLLTSDELFLRKVANNMKKLVAGRQPVVLVATGAFNPVHLQHTRMFYLARAHLNEKTEYQVVGGLLSPSHDIEVKNLLRVFPAQAIPIRHRAAMCEIAVSGSSWLAVGRWEATRRRVMNYNSVLQHVQQLLNNAFGSAAALPGEATWVTPTSSPTLAPLIPSPRTSQVQRSRVIPKVMYLCGADHLLQAGPQTLRAFGCICCARPGYTDELRAVIGQRYSRMVHIVDDDALLPTSLDTLSSTKVRKRMSAGKDIESLVGLNVASYIRATGISDKVAGTLPWTESDREPITYNATAAVRAALVSDRAMAVLHAQRDGKKGPSPTVERGRRLGRGSAATNNIRVSPVGVSRPALDPESSPDASSRKQRGSTLARVGVGAVSKESLPDFVLGPSKAGPALGGGKGRRHWPGGEPRPLAGGNLSVKAALAVGGAAAVSRPARSSLARGSNSAASLPQRRAWSGGPARVNERLANINQARQRLIANMKLPL